MSRSSSLPSGVATAAALSGYRAAYAVAIGFATPVRVTDAGTTLTVGGNSYVPGLVDVAGCSVDGMEGITVRVENAENTISSPDLSEGIVGKTLVVYEVHWSSAGAQLDPVTVFSGIVTDVQWADDVAEIAGRVTAQTAHGMVGRIISRLCMYQFKGDRCQYAGGTTSCDHTHAACTALSNTANYGGYRTMPNVGALFRYRVINTGVYAERAGSTVGGVVAPEPQPAGNVMTPGRAPRPVRKQVRRYLGRLIR